MNIPAPLSDVSAKPLSRVRRTYSHAMIHKVRLGVSREERQQSYQ